MYGCLQLCNWFFLCKLMKYITYTTRLRSRRALDYIIIIVTPTVYPCLVLNNYFSLCQPMGSLTKVQMSPHPILPIFREEKQSYPFPNPSSIKSWKQSFYWRWKYEMLQAFLLKNITNMKSICYLIHTNVIIFHYKSFIFILKKLKFCKQTCLSC